MSRRGIQSLLWAALISVTPAGVSAATVQNFNIDEKGSSFLRHKTNNPPEPETIRGGPLVRGRFLRITSALPEPAPPSSNTISFDATDTQLPAAIIADFDFRLTPGNAVVPGKGRADGFGFALLDLSSYGVTGIVEPQSPLFAAEEPNFTGSFGVGFDIYQSDDLGDEGDDNIRENFSSSISIHFAKALVEQFDTTSVVDIGSGRWIHARIELVFGSPSRVTVTLTPQGCEPAEVVSDHPISGLTPYAARAHFAARSGGQSAHHDLDNVNIQFLTSAQSIVSLRHVSRSADEDASSVEVTIERAGNTSAGAEVHLVTRNGSAKAGQDYAATKTLLTFAPNELTKTVEIPLIDDGTTERNEAFRIRLNRAGDGTVIGGPERARIKIYDDERARIRGRWSDVVCLPLVAVHMHVLPDGKVLLWDRLGALIRWDTTTGDVLETADPGVNLFCSGHSFLADGKLLVTGGHHPDGGPADDGIGMPHALLYDAALNTWTHLPDMNAGRWYPTNTTLASGQALVLSGSTHRDPPLTGAFIFNALPQVWQPSTSTWRDLLDARDQQLAAQPPKPLGLDLYPRMFLTSDGDVLKVGADQDTWYLGTEGSGTWTRGPDRNFGLRTYGSAVMYAPDKILVVGGGDVGDGTTPEPDATADAEVIDLSEAAPAWRAVSSLAVARRHLNATLLPDGKVLVTGGTGNPGFNNESNPALRAELWDPGTEEWTAGPRMEVTRGYHSTAVLLPDGTVASAGGGQGADATSAHNDAEIYLPPYLFKGPRPAVSSAPSEIVYGAGFSVGTSAAPDIAAVTLIRLPSVTHAFDQNQRFLSLEFTPIAQGLIVSAPSSVTAAPPGHYMMFLVSTEGVPSLARIVRLASAS